MKHSIDTLRSTPFFEMSSVLELRTLKLMHYETRLLK